MMGTLKANNVTLHHGLEFRTINDSSLVHLQAVPQ